MNRNHLVMFVTLCLFGVYVFDVVSGALWDTAFLSDVVAVILLVLTAVSFTAAILGFERTEKEKNNPKQPS